MKTKALTGCGYHGYNVADLTIGLLLMKKAKFFMMSSNYFVKNLIRCKNTQFVGVKYTVC